MARKSLASKACRAHYSVGPFFSEAVKNQVTTPDVLDMFYKSIQRSCLYRFYF